MKLKISIPLFCVFLAPQLLRASDWAVDSARNEPSTASGIVHREMEVGNARTGDDVRMELVTFPAKGEMLRVVDNPGGDADLAGAAPKHNAVAGVNGGYFDPKFAPLGLRIVDGRTAAPFLRARLLTGVLLGTKEGTQILRAGEYTPKRAAMTALQCGPVLVDGGHPVKGLDKERTARRTFVAVGGDKAALGFCSSVSLSDLALILSSVKLDDGWKISRALNLDGGSSSALWFRRAKGEPFSIVEYKNVRDFVIVAPAKE